MSKKQLFDEIKFTGAFQKAEQSERAGLGPKGPPKPFKAAIESDDEDDYDADPLVKILANQQEQMAQLMASRSTMDEDEKKALAKKCRKAKNCVDKLIIIQQDRLEKKRKKEEEKKIAAEAKEKATKKGKGKGTASAAAVKSTAAPVEKVEAPASAPVANFVMRPGVGRIVNLNVPEKQKHDVLSNVADRIVRW